MLARTAACSSIFFSKKNDLSKTFFLIMIIFFRENFTKRKYENFLKRAEQSMNEFLENFNAETREFYEKNRLNFAAENDIV